MSGSIRANRRYDLPHLPVRVAPPARLSAGGALVVGVPVGGALTVGVRVVGILGDGAGAGLDEVRGGIDSTFRELL